MPTETTEAPYIQTLRWHYRSIQQREGDAALRVTLSAERAATSHDPQMTASDKSEWSAALDLLEDELLPKTSSVH